MSKISRNCIIGSFLSVIVVFFVSCQTGSNRINVDISGIECDPIEIKRYEQKLFGIEPDHLSEELKKIQAEYGVFLNGDLDDSLNLIPLINYIGDTLLQNINSDCQLMYPDLSDLDTEFSLALRYHKYYYPNSSMSEIYTYVSGLDYEFPIQLMENNILIALDMYLGKDYYRYKKLGLPAYMLQRFEKSYIVKDCMKELAKKELNYKNVGSALLDMMINEGKIIWYVNAMMPTISDSLLLNYSASQMEWANNAEGIVWAFLLENEILYAKENQPIQKFIYESPFTSYFGAESPPRLGWFIGWKIVSSYMDNNRYVELQELMNDYDAQKILQQSGYKPGI